MKKIFGKPAPMNSDKIFKLFFNLYRGRNLWARIVLTKISQAILPTQIFGASYGPVWDIEAVNFLIYFSVRQNSKKES